MIIRTLLSLLPLILCVACSKPKDIQVGVTQGPLAEIAQFVADQARTQGIDVEIISYNDFMKPNEALAARAIHINIYQHEPFLKYDMNEHAYAFDVRGKAVLMPMCLYGSSNIKTFAGIPVGAKILIPADPTNNSRALLLLQAAQLITLSTSDNPTRKDVLNNPKKLRIVEVEAPLIPRLLRDDGDIAVINSDWAMLDDLNPKDALFTEDAESSTYENLMVVRKNENPDVLKKIDAFIAMYQSEAVKHFIRDRFKGAVIPAWTGDR